MKRRMGSMVILPLLSLMIGCATNNFSAVPEYERIPTRWDGRWEYAGDDANDRFYMWFEIKYGVISGRMGNTSWRGDVYLLISGKVVDDTFTFNRIYHPDYEHTYDLEVIQATESYINGYSYRGDKKRYKWIVKKKN